MAQSAGGERLFTVGSRYRIVETLGEGGAGAVYRAFDTAEGREVALKVLHSSAAGAGGKASGPGPALEEEFRVLASLSHSNLAEVHDYGITPGGLRYFTMEILRGEDVKSFLERRVEGRDRLAGDPLFRDLLIQVLSALDYIHTRGVIHEDLKPSNILVLPERGPAGTGTGVGGPRVKLIDFGLARHAESASLEVGGTVEYMAPERLRGQVGDRRSDLYSFGVLLFELLTGEPPFRGNAPREVSLKASQGLAPGALAPLPEPFRSVVGRLLSRSPADRLSTAYETLEALFGAEGPAARLLPVFGSAFVGRAQLLGQLRAAFQAARSQKGAAMLLKGESGIGKTRLLRELRIRFQLEGARVVMDAPSAAARRPGEVLSRLLRALTADLGPESPHQRMALAAVEALSPEGRSDLQQVASLPSLGEEAGRERLYHLISEFLLALSLERPLVLLIDELHQADPLDREFFLHLIRAMQESGHSSLLAVLAARSESEDDRQALALIEGTARSCAVFRSGEVPALSEEEVRDYLCQALGSAESFPEELSRTLARDTGGNPFFIEELLKLMSERGAVVREGARWRIPRALFLETPRSIQEVIVERVARIGGLPRAVLDWAAIFDAPFTAKEIQAWFAEEAAAAPPDLVEVEAALSDLVLAQVLARERLEYSLVHRRIGTVIYDSLPESERRRRHRRIGERLLGEGDLEAERRLERVAHHLFLSDRPESAREYLLRAGTRAQRSGALREASQYFTRALEVIRERERRFPVLLQREQVWGVLGERDRQLADLRELTALCAGLDDPRLEAETIVREAVYLDAVGRKKESIARFDAALALFTTARDRRGEARAKSRRAMVNLMLGEFEVALADLQAALAIARGEGDRGQEAECHQLLGVGLYLHARYDEALAQLGLAVSIQRELGEEQRVGALESNIGLIHFDRGNFEAAEERFKVSLRIFRAIGFRRGEAVNLVNLGLAYSEMGRYERALDFIGEALRIRRELGDRWGEGTDLGNLGTVYLRLGRFERAVPLLEEALSFARQIGNRASEGSNECKLGMVELHRGELDRARERFEKGLEIGRALRLTSLELLASTQLARWALLERDPARAIADLEGPLERATQSGMDHWRIECLALRASALHELGRSAEALEASGAAVDALRRFRGWMERSQEVWFIHSRVVAAFEAEEGRPAGEEGSSDEALGLAHAHLLEKAEAIRDEDLRAGFLQNLPLHRAIAEMIAARREAVRGEAARRERSLYEISKSINSILDLEPLLDRLLDLAVETTRAEKGMVVVRDLSGGLTVKAARDMAQESIADATEICQSVISDVSRRGEAIIAADASADERFRERKSIINFRIRSLMCVPLVVRGELIGAVYVDSRGETAFGREDLLFLSSFAHLAAIAIDNARLLARLREENLYLRREVETRFRFENLIGASAAMRAVFDTMEKVARTPASVLIIGETGTGKEQIARALHYHGPRKERPFVAVDCGALPENLLESELFGHRRGAFSGALYDRVGLFEEAEGGTIFLDEITNTTSDLQAKLLRVLQEGEIRRVGENQYRKVDVRVIAATNLPIEQAVEEGRFRQDLFYRLNVVPIRVPPLSERREDIPLLASHFLKRCAERLGRKVEGFTEEAMAVLVRSPWRGNVRELEHAIEKALILSERDRIGVDALADLPGAAAALAKAPSVPPGRPAAALEEPGEFAGMSLEDFDRRWLTAESAYLRHLVEEANGNFSQAARLARVRNRNTLIARLRRHGIGR